MAPRSRQSLYGFHYGSQLPVTESRSQRRTRLYHQQRTKSEIGRHLRRNVIPTNIPELIAGGQPANSESDANGRLDFDKLWLWEDTGEMMDQEDSISLAQMRALHEELIQQQKFKNWNDVMAALFPAYLHLKKETQNWTGSNSFDNYSSLICNCPPGNRKASSEFSLTSAPALLIRSTYWQTAMLQALRGGMSQCRSDYLPRVLRRNFVASVDVYRRLRSMQANLVQTVTSTTKQDILAQRSCPACFGESFPVTNPTQPTDNSKVFVCLDGNFQHRHHERASKNYVALEDQPLFIKPDELELANSQILEGERSNRVSEKAKDRCTEQHKAADDRRNASSWKGCDDTGLFGCCCRHDAVISFSNIHKSGEGRGHPTAIINRLFNEVQPNVQIGVVYDIGCTLKNFFTKRHLFHDYLDRMTFATAVFHSYVHDWPCQLQFNPRYNAGWGLTDGEGLERLWSYLSALVGPLSESFVERLATTASQTDSDHTLSILQQLQDLQKKHNEEAATLGSYFVVSTRAGPNSKQEKRLGLLWSAKNALYKCAVQIQGEMQPLRDSKLRGDRLGTVLKEKIFEALGRRKKAATRILKTFCNRRTDYLRNHAPDQLDQPENQEITYEEFTKLQLDDPFWNDGYMCIHAMLRLDRADEELEQLAFEFRRCLSWGVQYRNQLKHRIDECVFDTGGEHLKAILDSNFGQISYQTRRLVSDELESVQKKHEELLLMWDPDVEKIAALGVAFHAAVPVEWSATLTYLKTYSRPTQSNPDLDLMMEDTELNAQDSDGNSNDGDIPTTGNDINDGELPPLSDLVDIEDMAAPAS
ncbi:hypothetical protein PCASD_04225 [Puccinia coronata f. sp. avenae]|uniref:CxC1-like cysteine cluster associated with KDZ transposases domain-containing protein n=1 Tax=Puccinia coronata f. sp. avenae TaxID=200324 RepID=A0A2N5VEU4_9BASI|nr:hypothetical protein PCASD_04225 [Puccinia coronata f. sp. avenae]